MVRPLSLAQHTLYADLIEQGSDAVFDRNPQRMAASSSGENDLVHRPFMRTTGLSRSCRRCRSRPTLRPLPRARQRSGRGGADRTVSANQGGAGGARHDCARPDRSQDAEARPDGGEDRRGFGPCRAVFRPRRSHRRCRRPDYGGVLGVRLAKSRDAACRARPRSKSSSATDTIAEILAALRTVDRSFAARQDPPAHTARRPTCRSPSPNSIALTKRRPV